MSDRSEESRQLEGERQELLTRIVSMLELPMNVLGILWLVRMIVDSLVGLSPLLASLNYVIWGLFVAQFVLEFIIAPRKVAYSTASPSSAISPPRSRACSWHATRKEPTVSWRVHDSSRQCERISQC